MARKERTRDSRRNTGDPISEFKGMWLIAMFDLPVKEKPQRKAYARFRKHLLELGFLQIQYSVYAQFCSSEEASISKRRHVRANLPQQGQVRLVSLTDKQFSAMEVYLGREADTPEEPLGQGLLF